MNFRILILFLFLLAPACISVDVCDDEYDSELVARFKTVKDGATADTTVTAFTLYGIREGLSDSLLFDSITTSRFVVPLDPHQDYSSFVFEINGQTDTLIINYQKEAYMISYTCGFGMLFTLDKIDPGMGPVKNDTIIEKMIDAEYEDTEEHIWLYL